ncbi:MAG: tRNA (adenosine(37)-N6)-dimethylallyltransferase MiaA [Caldicoprobacter oshimai]|uniref:tRNA dimethylallyltransferase n=1 Tax=Caldicoprobacter faecalis TaxID=937334 RepID=A0A1I5RTJ2_9FIRM|nr:tRNA (adenosine(37)-N6)-dimethylallyltransferase MiaA [Caldicoprobacter faecalis]SFP61266.1 tRNA dimethylallyltransferase [Caldicoprobacter faecalis]
MEKKPLVVIVGPTAVGKTRLSIELAKALNGEIVSADSMQIYRYMDIGTAKPTAEERQGIPHHMMDIIDPGQEFSVAEYQRLATQAIDDIHSRNKLPIVVGGTGLYIKSLLYPMNFTDASYDQEFRKELQRQAETMGKEYLHKKLQAVDPKTAARLHPNDVRRVIRALEVYHLTGKPMSEYNQELEKMDYKYNVAMIGLTMDRAKLYERINQRVDEMIEKGLLDEVKQLLDRGYTRDMISMQGLGYKELIDYLQGRVSLEEAIYILKRETRRYAKRQLTWFRAQKDIAWVDVDQFESHEALAEWCLAYIKEKLNINP